MATIAPTINRDVGASGSVLTVTWVLPTTADVGQPFRLDRFASSSIQVFGTAVTAVAINGSNDPSAPTNWNALRDWNGNSLGALNAAGFFAPRDMPIWIAPTLTTGTAVTVAMALHRTDIGGAG